MKIILHSIKGPFFQDRSFDERLNMYDAEFVDVIHSSKYFGLDEKTGHMDFYEDGGASAVSACDDFTDRAKNHEYIVLYEDKINGNELVDNITMNEQELKEGVNSITSNSIKLKIKNMFGKIKNYVLSRPKRIFLKSHQFFGCSHLMSVRFFLYSINICEFKAIFCQKKNYKCLKTRGTNYPSPQMGYYADRSKEFYKKSNGKFFLETKSTAPYCYDKKLN